MMDNQLIQLAKNNFIAYANGDRELLEQSLADDFHFTSPLDNRINRETYFERCWPNHKKIADFHFIHAVNVNDKVFITYEGKLVSGRVFRNTEIFTINNNKIIEVEVYFGWNIPHKAVAGGFTDV